MKSKTGFIIVGVPDSNLSPKQSYENFNNPIKHNRNYLK